jgi:hypothetical protein
MTMTEVIQNLKKTNIVLATELKGFGHNLSSGNYAQIECECDHACECDCQCL